LSVGSAGDPRDLCGEGGALVEVEGVVEVMSRCGHFLCAELEGKGMERALQSVQVAWYGGRRRGGGGGGCGSVGCCYVHEEDGTKHHRAERSDPL
jgi:hypothetical protein